MQLHLHSYGTYFHVREAMFDVRKKQADGSWSSQQIAAHKVKSVWVSRGVAVSSDAVALALKNHVDVVFLEGDGAPIGRVWHSKLGSTTRIRRRQLEASAGAEGLFWVKKWIDEKMANQADFLRDLKKHRPQHLDFLNEKIEKIESLRASVAAVEGPFLSEKMGESLRGWEGTAGRLYFEAMSFVLPKPHQFEGRSARPAHDAFNAMLNYGYGILYSRVEKALMLAGLDPFVGFLHRDGYNHRSLVFDFIEPFRGWVDKTVFGLFTAKKVNQTHSEAVTGGVSLSAEGKKLLVEALNERLEGEQKRHRGRNRTRASILLLEAHRVAQELLTGERLGETEEPTGLEILTV